MAQPSEQKSLRTRFMELPLKARDWLTSERVTYFIVEMNERLDLQEQDLKIIPRLILRLVIKDFDPTEFIGEIARELDLTFSAAKILAQDIEEKILRPIEVPLRAEAGVDIRLIYNAKEIPSPILQALQEESVAPVVPPSTLIASPEAAHPGSQVKPGMTGEESPIKSPVYSPAPAEKIAASPTAPRNDERMMPPVKPPMPRVEPLPRPTQNISPIRPIGPIAEPVRPTPPTAPAQPTYVPKPTTMPSDTKNTAIPSRPAPSTPVQFKVGPSRVPKFPPQP